MLNKGDKVKIISNIHGEEFVGHIGIITGDRNCLTGGYSLDNEQEWYWDEDHLELVPKDTKKYLVYNLTSHKSVNHMTLESALKLAQSSPQCEFQLYELKYNVVAKPVEVQYEAIEVK